MSLTLDGGGTGDIFFLITDQTCQWHSQGSRHAPPGSRKPQRTLYFIRGVYTAKAVAEPSPGDTVNRRHLWEPTEASFSPLKPLRRLRFVQLSCLWPLGWNWQMPHGEQRPPVRACPSAFLRPGLSVPQVFAAWAALQCLRTDTLSISCSASRFHGKGSLPHADPPAPAEEIPHLRRSRQQTWNFRANPVT